MKVIILFYESQLNFLQQRMFYLKLRQGVSKLATLSIHITLSILLQRSYKHCNNLQTSFPKNLLQISKAKKKFYNRTYVWQILTNVGRPPPIVVTSSMGRVAIPPVDMDVLVTKDSLETDLFVQVSGGSEDIFFLLFLFLLIDNLWLKFKAKLGIKIQIKYSNFNLYIFEISLYL